MHGMKDSQPVLTAGLLDMVFSHGRWRFGIPERDHYDDDTLMRAMSTLEKRRNERMMASRQK
jgi:hypothetical protein